MKYFFLLLFALIITGCSKKEDPVATETPDPPNVLYLYNKTGIFDSVVSNYSDSIYLGHWNLYYDYKYLCFDYQIKTNTSSHLVKIKSNPDLFHFYMTNFYPDSNYHPYSNKLLKIEGETSVYVQLIASFAHYIVMKDLKVYLTN